MNEKSEISGLEKLHKKTKNTAIAAGYIALIGVMLIGLAAFVGIGMSFTMDDNHLQNPKMAHDQYPENASYVWTHSEIMHMTNALIPIALAGVIALIGGMIVLIFLPNKKDFHKLGCAFGKLMIFEFGKTRLGFDRNPDMKYCPECGVKLSELEPRKQDN